MKLKIRLSKADKIIALLNQWDPEGRYANGEGLRSYSYEGETIAQDIRSNSKTETIEKAIREAFSEVELVDNEVKEIAAYIKRTMKN